MSKKMQMLMGTTVVVAALASEYFVWAYSALVAEASRAQSQMIVLANAEVVQLATRAEREYVEPMNLRA